MGETSLLLQSSLASAFFNVASDRFRDAPRDKRDGEGWTEAWGDPASAAAAAAASTSEAKHDDSDNACWELDRTAVSELLGTEHPQEQIKLLQFRPAWLEQFALSVAGLPFVVVNSPYIATEATGPLPYIQDLHPGHAVGNRSTDAVDGPRQAPPILVGRNHPQVSPSVTSTTSFHGNDILGYLSQRKNVDLDAPIRNDAKKVARSKLLVSLVQEELERVLLFLRYEDSDAWEQVYRPQSYKASSVSSYTTSVALAPSSSSSSSDGQARWFQPSRLGGMLQAWCERATARKLIRSTTRGWNRDVATANARTAYTALEEQLKSVTPAESGTPTLLGQPEPTLADAVLWDHLARALCDVHLVVVLADFPHLVKFFQVLYEAYFTVHSDSLPYQRWNCQQNHLNPFHRIPLGEHRGNTQYKDAIELMQSMSVRQQDLQETLNVTKRQRGAESWPKRTDGTESPFYRWRFGDALKQTANDGSENDGQSSSTDTPQRRKLLRDQKRNDQVWASGVIGVSLLAILLLQQGFGEAGE